MHRLIIATDSSVISPKTMPSVAIPSFQYLCGSPTDAWRVPAAQVPQEEHRNQPSTEVDADD